MPKAISPYPRYLAPRLREALADTPAVLIHGPRQCGKTTLARMVGGRSGYRYVSFDDDAVRAAACGDPCVVLYDGSASINLGEKLFAVPLRQLWEH